MTEPLVTVISTCYNHARFILECLDSLKAQTYKNTQLIIIDDCSLDDSVSVIRNWIDQNKINCLFIAHETNWGICRTLNEALSHAKGDYVSFCSADDIWLTDKLEHQGRQMQALPEDVGVLYSDAALMDESGKPLDGMFISREARFSKVPEGDIFKELLQRNWIPVTTTLVRRSVYEKVGFYDERLCYEDYDMWLRISRHYKFAYSPFVSVMYRIVPNSLVRAMGSDGRGMKSNVLIYLKHLGLDRSCDEIIARRLADLAYPFYSSAYSGRDPYLWKIFKACGTFRLFVIFTFSFLRVPFPWYQRLKGVFNNIRRKSDDVPSGEVSG